MPRRRGTLLQYATALIMTPAAATSSRAAAPPKRRRRTSPTPSGSSTPRSRGRWEGVWTTFDSQGIEQLAHTGCWDVSLDGDDAVHKMEVPGPDGYPRQRPVGTLYQVVI